MVAKSDSAENTSKSREIKHTYLKVIEVGE